MPSGTRETSALVNEQIENRRLRSLDIELEKITDEFELQIRRRDIAAAGLRRFEQLADSKFVSAIQVQQQQEAQIDQDARLKSLERNLNSSRKVRAATKSVSFSMQIQERTST
jgi:membrane fusion protein